MIYVKDNVQRIVDDPVKAAKLEADGFTLVEESSKKAEPAQSEIQGAEEAPKKQPKRRQRTN